MHKSESWKELIKLENVYPAFRIHSIYMHSSDLY